jgi:hypothetical protein
MSRTIGVVALLGSITIAALAQDVEPAIRDAYRQAFGETIPNPAIFNDDRSVDCSQNGHATTTAYLKSSDKRSMLLQMYLSRDGTRITRQSRSEVFTPAGTFRNLVVIVAYGATVNANSLTMFEDAQKQINEDHAAFARSRGYAAPLVVFENTNLLVAPNEIGDPHKPRDVRSAASRKGLSPERFDFVIVIDPNPAQSAGGLSMPGGDIYVGNYSHWTTPLRAQDWMKIAWTTFHHEVAHQWGWVHDWSPTCGGTKLGFEPFIAAPVLFGWEDVDGDRVPEIIDQTPYGRAR